MSLQVTDYFADARRLEDQLVLAPCPEERLEPTPLTSVQAQLIDLLRPVPPPPRPLYATPFGAVQRLDELQAELSNAILQSAVRAAQTVDAGDGSDSDGSDDDDVVERLLRRDQTPRPALRKLEQRLMREPPPPPGPLEQLRQALGEPRPPAEWPVTVHALREKYFRMSFHSIGPSFECIEAAQSRRPRGGSMAGFRKRLLAPAPADEYTESDVTHLTLGLESKLLPPQHPAVTDGGGILAVHDLEFWLRPHRSTASSLQPLLSPLPEAESARAAISRALAPLGSQRERRERMARLLASATMPPALDPAPALGPWPRSLAVFRTSAAHKSAEARLFGGSELRELESKLLPLPPFCEQATAVYCPIHQLLNARPPKQPTKPHPASGVEPSVLHTLEARRLQRLLDAGDLTSQVAPDHHAWTHDPPYRRALTRRAATVSCRYEC